MAMAHGKLTPFLILLALFPFTLADPDPVLDFCVPETGSLVPDPNRLTSLPCKNPSNLTANDFIFSGIRSPGNFSSSTGFAGVAVNAAQFLALNSLGMSFARADFEPGGVNPPHYHPRATETALVVEGSVYSGFVDSGGRVFARVIEKGEVMVFPKGMIHFQMNAGDSPATIFGSFNSQSPGLVRIPGAVFGSAIKEELMERAFGLSAKELQRLRRRFSPN